MNNACGQANGQDTSKSRSEELAGLNSPVCPQPVFKRMHTETAMTTTARKADVSISSYTPGILSKASRISLLFADDDEMLIEILAF